LFEQAENKNANNNHNNKRLCVSNFDGDMVPIIPASSNNHHNN
jgi:hypothetical protein